MSKLVAVLFAASGVSALSVGSVYLYKAGSLEGTGQQTGSTSQGTDSTAFEKIPEELGFQNLNDFKTNKGGECAKKFLAELDYNNPTDDSSTNVDSNYFSSEGEDVKSCLVINGEKTTSTNTPQKGKGGIRGLGTFKKGNKGFVMFVTTKESSTQHTLGLDGGIYFAEQANSTGTIKKHKSVDASKVINTSELDNLFFKAGTDIKSGLTVTGDTSSDKSYWGFLKDSNDLSNLCAQSATDCSSGTPSPLKQSWVGTTSSDSDKTLKDGSENFDTWADKLFKEEGKLNLKDAIGTIKGTGAKQTTAPSS